MFKMKKVLITCLSFVLLMSLSTQGIIAQTSMGEFQEGIIELQSGETQVGFIQTADQVSAQHSIIFYELNDQVNGKAYTASDVQSYKVNGKRYQSAKFEGKDLFLESNLTGAISLYTFLYYDAQSVLRSKTLMQKGTKSLVDMNTYEGSFKNKMVKLLKDNEAIVQKIKQEANGYTFPYFYRIMQEYNTEVK